MMAAKVTTVSIISPTVAHGQAMSNRSHSAMSANSAAICATPISAGVSQAARPTRTGERSAVIARRDSGLVMSISAYMPIHAARLKKNGASPAP